jgi:peptidoglycan hydrolase-like protein with peptidoglycan-binding domain
MARANNLAAVLRKYGCNVVEVAGWQTRGSSTFNPKGVVAHHTAGPRVGDAPSLGICIRGRSDLPGPLAQVVLSRSGICYVIASGRANHAGTGGYRGLSGNSSVFGIEAENTGTGEPWGAAQLEAYYRCTAAMLEIAGRDATWVCVHKEWTSRKIDPYGINMNEFRVKVGVRLGKPQSPPGGYNPANPGTAGSTGPLRLGSRGAEVRSLQNTLNFWGYDAGAADGVFGRKTEEAVKAHQRSLKIPADGVWGPASQKAHEAFVRAMQAYVASLPKQRPAVKKGWTGDYVVLLQTLLRLPRRDGIFDVQVENAVKTFQVSRGLTPNGVVGEATWDMLAKNPPKPVVRLGWEGDVVRLLQTLLNKKGYKLVVNGRFDKATEAAVKDFEKKCGFVVDGVVTEELWKRLS